MGQGTLKSNDFARGAAKRGQITAEQKKTARQALLEKAKQKAQQNKK